ncbi:MAG: hypothetical protein V3U71_09330 [Cocleimonas sp.]
MPQNFNIPTVSNLVSAGDPSLKSNSVSTGFSTSSDELNLRIEELENAIGQDNIEPIGRAYAIRSEENEDEFTN